MWDAERQTVMHSLVILRAVGVLAGGKYTGEKDAAGRAVIEVAAKEFRHRVVVGNGTLSYSETTMVDIYGKHFEHTDQNKLTLVRG
jgi:hypothetical protein